MPFSLSGSCANSFCLWRHHLHRPRRLRWRCRQRSRWRAKVCVTPPTLRRLLCHKTAPFCRTHHIEGSLGPPEDVYGRGVDKGQPCVVSGEIDKIKWSFVYDHGTQSVNPNSKLQTYIVEFLSILINPTPKRYIVFLLDFYVSMFFYLTSRALFPALFGVVVFRGRLPEFVRLQVAEAMYVVEVKK